MHVSQWAKDNQRVFAATLCCSCGEFTGFPALMRFAASRLFSKIALARDFNFVLRLASYPLIALSPENAKTKVIGLVGEGVWV